MQASGITGNNVRNPGEIFKSRFNAPEASAGKRCLLPFRFFVCDRLSIRMLTGTHFWFQGIRSHSGMTAYNKI
jgi:hypothetical protein